MTLSRSKPIFYAFYIFRLTSTRSCSARHNHRRAVVCAAGWRIFGRFYGRSVDRLQQYARRGRVPAGALPRKHASGRALGDADHARRAECVQRY